MANKYKILTENEKRGDWIHKFQFVDLMKLAYSRNRKTYEWLKNIYEFLEDEKFDESLVNNNKKSITRRIQK